MLLDMLYDSDKDLYVFDHAGGLGWTGVGGVAAVVVAECMAGRKAFHRSSVRTLHVLG